MKRISARTLKRFDAHHVYADATISVFERCFERFDDAGTVLVGERYGILDDFESVAALFHFIVALLGEQIANLLFCEILRDVHRKGYSELSVGR